MVGPEFIEGWAENVILSFDYVQDKLAQEMPAVGLSNQRFQAFRTAPVFADFTLRGFRPHQGQTVQ